MSLSGGVEVATTCPQTEFARHFVKEQVKRVAAKSHKANNIS